MMMKEVGSSRSVGSAVVIAVMVIISMSTSARGCTPEAYPCFSESECCDGYACELPVFSESVYNICTKCVGSGATCGRLDPCCPGLTCDGPFSFFSGTSERLKFMALHHSCFILLILLSMAVVSSASDVSNGYIPNPEYSAPDDQPRQHDNVENPSKLKNNVS